jgi:hypothetical protein
MAEYTCCSSVAFERPNEHTFTFAFPPSPTYLLPGPLSPPGPLSSTSANSPVRVCVEGGSVGSPPPPRRGTLAALSAEDRSSGPPVTGLLTPTRTGTSTLDGAQEGAGASSKVEPEGATGRVAPGPWVPSQGGWLIDGVGCVRVCMRTVSGDWLYQLPVRPPCKYLSPRVLLLFCVGQLPA